MEASTARHALLESVADEIHHNHPSGRIVIAIDGPDASGKTRFADGLAEAFRRRGVAAFRASLADFEGPDATGDAQARYRNGFDHKGEGFGADGAEKSAAPENAALIVDGVFLNRPELSTRWHHSIWLDADADVRAQRLHERDGIEPGSEQAARYRTAQRLYYREAHPNTAATDIIDNTDPDAPVRRFADYCTIQPPP
jgi:uridine kinase